MTRRQLAARGAAAPLAAAARIDRRRLVRRHNSYENGIPLCTMSQWGWHTRPGRPAGELRLAVYDTYGRPVGYPASATGQEELFNWLRENPQTVTSPTATTISARACTCTCPATAACSPPPP